MKKIIITILVCAIGYIGCTTNSSRHLDEYDITEVVIRYLFEHNGSGLNCNQTIFFLGQYDPATSKRGDLNARLMQRFAHLKPRVSRLSEAKVAIDTGTITHATTGEEGVVLIIASIRWISPDYVEVDGGYDHGVESASANTFYVRRVKGRWIVEKDVCHGMA